MAFPHEKAVSQSHSDALMQYQYPNQIVNGIPDKQSY